jgi:anti-sigma regulatory factor (Ser/Thr protein kinase)
MVRQEFPGFFNSLSSISDFIVEQANAAGFDENETYQVQLALDEACTNIIEHGYGGEGRGSIIIEAQPTKSGLEIKVEDSANAFDPDAIPEPRIGVPLEELGSRGAGVYLMKKIMDEVEFEFLPGGGTVLKMVKNKSGA